MKTSFLAMAVATIGIALHAQKAAAPLRVIVTKGESYEYATKAAIENRVTMMGNDQVSKINSTMKTVMKVVSTSKDSSDFAVNLADVEIAIKGNMMMGTTDTTFKRATMPGSAERVSVSPSGKILHRTREEDSAETSGNDVAIMRQLGGSRGAVRSLFIVFPDKAVNAGEEWTDTRIDTMDQGNGKIINSITMRYVCEGAFDTLGMKCIRIKAKSERYVINGTMKQMGTEMTMEGDGVVKTTYIIEQKTGMPVVVSSNMETDQRLVVGEGMEIPISMTMSSELTRVKK